MQLGTTIPDILPTFVGGTQEEATHWARVYAAENKTDVPKRIAMCHLSKHILKYRPQTLRVIFCGSYRSNKRFQQCYNDLHYKNFSIEFYGE